MSQNYLLRQPKSDDLAFVMATWLKSICNTDIYTYIAPKHFYPNHQKLIEKCLAKSLVIIACDPEDQSHLYGYIVFQPTEENKIVHFIYIKKAFREFGLASDLLEAAYPNYDGELVLTHLDRIKYEVVQGKVKRRSIFIFQRDTKKLFYNPYLFYRIGET